MAATCGAAGGTRRLGWRRLGRRLAGVNRHGRAGARAAAATPFHRCCPPLARRQRPGRRTAPVRGAAYPPVRAVHSARPLAAPRGASGARRFDSARRRACHSAAVLGIGPSAIPTPPSGAVGGGGCARGGAVGIRSVGRRGSARGSSAGRRSRNRRNRTSRSATAPPLLPPIMSSSWAEGGGRRRRRWRHGGGFGGGTAAETQWRRRRRRHHHHREEEE